MLAYHGTAISHLAAIKKKGLLPGAGKGADTWARAHGNSNFDDNAFDPKIFVSTKQDVARMFASYTADILKSKPALLTVEINRADWHEDDKSGPSMGALWSKKPIPPSAILAAEELPLDVNDDPFGSSMTFGAADALLASLLRGR